MKLAELRALTWPNVRWGPHDKPVAIVDGVLHRLTGDAQPVEGRAAYAVGVDDASLATLCERVRVEALHLYEVRARTIEPLRRCAHLRALAVHWATKPTDLAPLGALSALETLMLVDTPKANDLAPLSRLKSLHGLEFSGGIWNKHRATSLEPLAGLDELREVRLLNLKVDSGGLRPLAACSRLEDLELSNQFETADYAFLASRLPRTRCAKFAAWVRLEPAVGGKDTLVVGRRKPLLDSRVDGARLRAFEAAFEELRAGFAS
jgi:hypothetical protein